MSFQVKTADFRFFCFLLNLGGEVLAEPVGQLRRCFCDLLNHIRYPWGSTVADNLDTEKNDETAKEWCRAFLRVRERDAAGSVIPKGERAFMYHVYGNAHHNNADRGHEAAHTHDEDTERTRESVAHGRRVAIQ